MVNKFFIGLIILAFLCSLYVAAQRWAVESKNKTVSLVVDYQDIEALSARTGRQIGELLAELKSAGANAVSITEDTLESLEDSGQLAILPTHFFGLVYLGEEKTSEPFSPAPLTGGPEHKIALIIPNRKYQRVKENLENKWAGRLSVFSFRKFSVILPEEGTKEELADIGLGLDPSKIEKAKKRGFDIIARVKNFPGVTPKGIDFTIRKLKELGASTVIFDKEEILGYRDLIKCTAETLNKYKVKYGYIEFAKQRGDNALAWSLDGKIIRVHSIREDEMSEIDPQVAVDRFIRGVRERNIRMCYLRLFRQAQENPVEFNAQYVSSIRNGLESKGFGVGSANFFDDFKVPIGFLFLISLGAISGGILLLERLVALSAKDKLALLFIFVFLTLVGFALVGLNLTRKILALCTAIIFPTLALTVFGIVAWGSGTDKLGNLVKEATKKLLVVSLVTLIGAFLVVGLLSEPKFMVQVDRFRGVKVALSVPLLLIALIYISGIPERSKDGTSGMTPTERLKAFFESPILTRHTVLILLAVGALAYLFMRSGNQPILKISPLELKMRAFLEDLFGIRPRWKDIIGHPILMFATAWALKGKGRYIPLLVSAGMVGQVSIMNAFCHLHTALPTSLLRVLAGLFCGLILGLIIIVLYELYERIRVSKSRLSALFSEK